MCIRDRFKRWNEKIADDPVWEEAIVDRVKLMVERDKNRFCIVMWLSLIHIYPKKERICVQEAHTLGIPLIGICDTNCDPEELDYVIPGNDDAIRAVKLIVSKMADAVIEANQGTAEADGEIEAESEEFAETVEE